MASIYLVRHGQNEDNAEGILNGHRDRPLTGQPVTSVLGLPAEQVLRTEGGNYFLEAEGAEDFPTLYGRAESVLARVQREHSNERVLLVTYGDIGKMIRAVYHGWDWKTGLLTPHFENAGVLELCAESDVVM